MDCPQPTDEVNPNLIFDIGLHTGEDAHYYLNKGFNVVALEAREDLCETARSRIIEFKESNRFEIVNKALFSKSGQMVSFFINDKKDDWGSLYRYAPEQDGSKSREIKVSTITLNDLFEEFGVPYYIKCDIEGGDALFVEQLMMSSCRPSYVSIEATSVIDVAKLAQCGYTSFQLVNQYLNPYAKEPDPVREGLRAGGNFTHHMSGLFGKDLPLEKWRDIQHTMKLFMDWYDIYQRDSSLAVGWIDVHAHRPQL
jgi:FkbM family methyltransferase